MERKSLFHRRFSEPKKQEHVMFRFSDPLYQKRWLKLLFVMFILFLPMAVEAQTGLNVAPFFDGRFNHSRQVVTLLVKGKPLKAYKLEVYRSMTFEADMPVVENIEQAVIADSKMATDKETGYKNGRLLYGFYCFSPGNSKKKVLRYLFYRRNENKAYIIYMEGNASMEELKRMFMK
jgi:hypothetical protein